MDAAELVETLESAFETELSRLGSSKAIYAVTGGEMEAEAVDAAIVARAASALETLEGWPEEPPAGTAETLRSWIDELDAAAHADPDRASVELPAAGSAVGLGGALLAWLEMTDRTLAQSVGFFVGSADTASADRYRGFRTDLEALRGACRGWLDDRCGGEDDWTTAREAAAETIEAAYARYVESLESMGVKVKPVC